MSDLTAAEMLGSMARRASISAGVMVMVARTVGKAPSALRPAPGRVPPRGHAT